MSEIPKEVVRRYAFKHEISVPEAEYVFHDLERFLDIAISSSASPSLTVDEAWHEFILHTRLYADYCQSRYGTFVHHIPLSPILLDGDPKETGQGTKKCCGTGLHPSIDESEAMLTMPIGHRCSSDCRGSCRGSHLGEEASS